MEEGENGGKGGWRKGGWRNGRQLALELVAFCFYLVKITAYCALDNTVGSKISEQVFYGVG